MNDPKNDVQSTLRAREDIRGVYQHRKGGIYTLYSVTIDENSLETTVSYYSPSRDSRWTRTLSDWTEEVEGKPRFWKIRDATPLELVIAANLDSFINVDWLT